MALQARHRWMAEVTASAFGKDVQFVEDVFREHGHICHVLHYTSLIKVTITNSWTELFENSSI
jgi:hypothetical protein